jgi:hypothetical protein
LLPATEKVRKERSNALRCGYQASAGRSRMP